MNYSVTVSLIASLLITLSPNMLHSADLYNSVPGGSTFQPFENDPAINNDCDYCHTLHNAYKHRGSSALLNKNREHYERYLPDPIFSVNTELTGTAKDNSRKCPRSR